MSYEDAPATTMLATHCACCGRSLVDAKSVECGVGPECRKRHGFDIEVSEEARAEANRLVYEIAREQDGPSVLQNVARLRELGFEKLADRVVKRIDPIRIDAEGDRLIIKTPYSPRATDAWRRIPGRWWDRERKANSVPAAQRARVWRLLQDFFPGEQGIGPKGPFAIPGGTFSLPLTSRTPSAREHTSRPRKETKMTYRVDLQCDDGQWDGMGKEDCDHETVSEAISHARYLTEEEYPGSATRVVDETSGLVVWES